MANNTLTEKLGLTKIEDGWIDKTGHWKASKAYRGYHVSHLPSGMEQVCVGVRTLASAVSLMDEENLKNRSYFRLPEPSPVSTLKTGDLSM